MNATVFTNDWWTWVWQTYNMSILGFPVLISFILKLIAIYNPKIKSNEVIDLLNEYWPKNKPKQEKV